MPMPLIPDIAIFQRKLATLPLVTYMPDETVLSAASTTGWLLILKEGAVAVEKEGVEIARVTEPGAVFGELSVLLNQPHTADVRALEASQFHVADAATILRIDPVALLYVATVLAQRRDSANRGLLELKRNPKHRRADRARARDRPNLRKDGVDSARARPGACPCGGGVNKYPAHTLQRRSSFQRATGFIVASICHQVRAGFCLLLRGSATLD